MVVLDVPLLLESGPRNNLDAVVVVSAPADVQRQRVLERANMTPEKLEAILGRQLPDAQKRAQAHFVIDTGQGLEHAREQVRAAVAELRAPDWPARKAALEAARKPPQ
jgi:dephospho-CoA kinase